MIIGFFAMVATVALWLKGTSPLASLALSALTSMLVQPTKPIR